MPKTRDAQLPRQLSRRGFLTGSAATLATTSLVGAPGALAATGDGKTGSGGGEGFNRTFGRMFPKLPAFAAPSEALTAALVDIGKPGGIMDAKDAMEKGALALQLAQSPTNRDNPNHTEGTHFVGQFLDHDITFDPYSKLNVPVDPQSSPNARTPRFDLES